MSHIADIEFRRGGGGDNIKQYRAVSNLVCQTDAIDGEMLPPSAMFPRVYVIEYAVFKIR